MKRDSRARSTTLWSNRDLLNFGSGDGGLLLLCNGRRLLLCLVDLGSGASGGGGGQDGDGTHDSLQKKLHLFVGSVCFVVAISRLFSIIYAFVPAQVNKPSAPNWTSFFGRANLPLHNWLNCWRPR